MANKKSRHLAVVIVRSNDNYIAYYICQYFN